LFFFTPPTVSRQGDFWGCAAAHSLCDPKHVHCRAVENFRCARVTFVPRTPCADRDLERRSREGERLVGRRRAKSCLRGGRALRKTLGHMSARCGEGRRARRRAHGAVATDTSATACESAHAICWSQEATSNGLLPWPSPLDSCSSSTNEAFHPYHGRHLMNFAQRGIIHSAHYKQPIFKICPVRNVFSRFSANGVEPRPVGVPC